ncbi:MAG: hypothetical protein PHP70_02905 [Gallionella sp.]|nr:hypothetical protein [Gallionella sp.]
MPQTKLARDFIRLSLYKLNMTFGMVPRSFSMKLTLKIFLPALFMAFLSPSVAAMSLGDGQIISRVGEPFSANIALIGAYDKDIKFYQVKGGECRSSLIGSTATGCDSVYEGRLTFFIKKKPDGQYFLRVIGERSEDFFYRLIIKYKSPSSGSVYKAFDFLPEFRSHNDMAAVPSYDEDHAVNAALPSGKYGVLMGNIVEMTSDAEDKPAAHEPTKAVPDKNESLPAEADATATNPPETVRRKNRSETPTKPALKAKQPKNNAAAAELKIKKEGSYADEIFVLQKENEAIEQQIALLEKQIALLKEVDRLKAQAAAPSAPALALEMTPAIGIPESSPVATPAPAPVKIPAQIATPTDDRGISVLSWILIAVILLLIALLWLLHRRQKNLFKKYSQDEFKSAIVSPTTAEDNKYFDLINDFSRK